MKLLFWNTNQRDLGTLLESAAALHVPDLLILAESAADPTKLARSLSAQVVGSYQYIPTPTKSSRPLQILSRLPKGRVSYLQESGDLTCLRVRPVIGQEIVVCGVHLRSKLYSRDIDQSFLALRLRHEIERIEAHAGHARTLLVGDFNMNPFEAGIVSAEALHALPVRSVVERVSRTVAGRKRTFFYNPMWRFFDDRSSSPGGTYYRSDGAPLCYFWNIFDQVLLRPELISDFPDDGVEVLTSMGEDADLLTPSQVPNSGEFSDHLPIMLRFRSSRRNQHDAA